MKKIGQVTYCGENYGSVLQCYATQKVLSDKGIKCILLKRKEKGIGKLLYSLEFRIDRWYKFVKYPKFRQKFKRILNSTSECGGMNPESVYKTNQFVISHINQKEASYSKLKQIARKKDYIAFFSGSDQIWSATWFIKNKMWFLRFAPREKRVAWMPSFGSDKVREYNLPVYKKYISEYAFLSSREKSGAEIITEMTGRPAAALSDPVILLSADQWRDIATTSYEEKYILLFFLDKPSDTAMEMLRKLHKETGYKSVVFSYEYNCLEGIEVKSGGPQDFISLIDNAAFVLTDSFHACMFSVIFKVPYYVFYRNKRDVSRQSARITNLLNIYGMQNRLIDTPRNVEKEDFKMNEDKIDHVLSKKKEEITEYLDSVIRKYNG